MKEALGGNWTENDLEMNQDFNQKGNAKPGRDTLMMVLNSDVISKKHMGEFFDVSKLIFGHFVGNY